MKFSKDVDPFIIDRILMGELTGTTAYKQFVQQVDFFSQRFTEQQILEHYPELVRELAPLAFSMQLTLISAVAFPKILTGMQASFAALMEDLSPKGGLFLIHGLSAPDVIRENSGIVRSFLSSDVIQNAFAKSQEELQTA